MPSRVACAAAERPAGAYLGTSGGSSSLRQPLDAAAHVLLEEADLPEALLSDCSRHRRSHLAKSASLLQYDGRVFPILVL